MKEMESKQGKLFKSTVFEKRYNTAKYRLYHEPTIEDASFQHTVFCQAPLPYKNPKDLVRWKKVQGKVILSIQSLEVDHPLGSTRLGLPYGTKARLILAYMNTQAIKKQSSIVDVQNSMTQFIKRIGLANKGQNFHAVREQLSRIASSVVMLSYQDEQSSYNVNFTMVKKYNMWLPKGSNKRVIWPTFIQLTEDYFQNLLKHAIPLDERALAALSNNAVALDIYMWLAQRLHRIPMNRPQFIAWKNLKDQFGEGYGRMDNFKRSFRNNLSTVKMVYKDANFEEDRNKGLILKNSASPIPKKIYLVS